MFGFTPTLTTIAAIGVVLLTLLTFQIVLGMRWIKLKGRTHWKVHKWLAWTIFGIAVVHGTFGLIASGIL
jgi:hypothetical protein